VTRDDIAQFHKQFYGASNAELAVVGDFDANAMRDLVTQLFADWKSPSPYTRVPTPLVPNKPADLKFEAPDKANAFLMAREATPINDTNPDYPALLVANYIFGDSASSRLWERLRQKEGLSYGVGSFFRESSFEPNSTLGLYAIFAPQNLDRVRGGFREELQSALAKGFTEVELAHAKAGLLEERRLSRAEDHRLGSELVQQEYLGRTWAREGAIDAAISKLTLADVNAALRKYMKPEDLAYSYAGDFGKK